MRRKALKVAFPHTLPILTGFAFLGLAYGIYMNTSGFPFYYPMLMSMLIFGGSLEFVAVEMLLSPFAPHICEEIWEFIGGEGLLAVSEWPKYDEGKTIAKTVEIGVQVNGKVRGTIVIPNGCEKEKAFEIAKADERIASFLEGKNLIKEIYVPNKIVNFVAK